jgi:hydroxyethylthiazole kinase
LNLIRIMPAEGWMSGHAPAFAHALVVTPVLDRLRRKTPLVHNITNFVVMNYTANALLAVGASPAMVHAPEEAAEFAAISSALVVNIGTLDATFVAGMGRAVESANAKAIPWVLDPVGAGATDYRTDVAMRLAALRPAVIRGNAGEISALAGRRDAASRGVDSLSPSESAVVAGKALAERTGAVVAITGATDYVIGAGVTTEIAGGDPMSQRVTGTGCTATALVGACLAVAPPRDAAITALALMKAAAERAVYTAQEPGSFAVALIDALYALTVAKEAA